MGAFAGRAAKRLSKRQRGMRPAIAHQHFLANAARSYAPSCGEPRRVEGRFPLLGSIVRRIVWMREIRLAGCKEGGDCRSGAKRAASVARRSG